MTIEEELEHLREFVKKQDKLESIKFLSAHIAQGIYSGRENSFSNIDKDLVAETVVELAFKIEEYAIKRISNKSN